MATRLKLYASNNSTFVYDFPIVQTHNADSLGQKELITYRNYRAAGATYLQGGAESEDLIIEGVLSATSYTTLKSAISTLKSTIVQNTVYVLRIYTDATNYDSFTVKMLDKITCSIEEQQTRTSKYIVKFKTNAA
jgi:hypothetical protein